MNGRLTRALAGVVLSTSIVSAQQAMRPAPASTASKQANSVSQRAAREIRGLIKGTAVDSEGVAVRRASLRLRNLKVNAIEHIGTTNELGEFSFAVQPEIPYVVEVADPAGRIVGVGDVILINPGEVASTVLVLPSRASAFVGGFGETAAAVVSAATGAGLAVVDQALPKVSPTR